MKEDDRVLDTSYQMNVYAKETDGDNNLYVNVFMWDQLWGVPVFVSDSNPQYEYKFSKVTVTDKDKPKLDKAQKEIYDFYVENSTGIFQSEGKYKWSDASWQRTFKLYSSKNSDSGLIKVTDRFGNVYTAKVSW